MQLIVLVSATSLVVTKGLAEHFGAHIVCGSVCPRSPNDADGGCRITRAHYRNSLLVGEVKEELLARLISEHKIDAASSFAYSDHPSDAPSESNDELCIRNEEFCIKTEDFCSK